MANKPKTTIGTNLMPRSLTYNQVTLLKLVDSLGPSAYVNYIFRAINKGRTDDRLVDVGAIHISLNRLRKAGILETYDHQANDFKDGRIRDVLVYRLTPVGRTLLDAEVAKYRAT